MNRVAGGTLIAGPPATGGTKEPGMPEMHVLGVEFLPKRGPRTPLFLEETGDLQVAIDTPDCGARR